MESHNKKQEGADVTAGTHAVSTVKVFSEKVILQDAGFTVDCRHVYDDEVPEGAVVFTKQEPGDETGSMVMVTVSLGAMNPDTEE